MAHIQQGTRVRLDCPDPAFEGVDPKPLEVGAEGVVVQEYGSIVTVAWDAGFETDVPRNILRRSAG